MSMINNQDTIQSTQNSVKSSRIFLIIIALVIALQVIRLGAWGLVGDVLAGKTAMEWLFPAAMDVIVGILALPVALVVLRGHGVFAWTIIIGFFILSFVDHADFYSVVLNSNALLPTSIGTKNAWLMMVSVLLSLELIAFFMMMTHRVREHFLGNKNY